MFLMNYYSAMLLDNGFEKKIRQYVCRKCLFSNLIKLVDKN